MLAAYLRSAGENVRRVYLFADVATSWDDLGLSAAYPAVPVLEEDVTQLELSRRAPPPARPCAFRRAYDALFRRSTARGNDSLLCPVPRRRHMLLR